MPFDDTAKMAAVALSGFGIWQLASLYQSTAPKLETLRSAPADDTHIGQILRDANTVTGTVAIGAGALASFAAKSPIPLLVIGGVWLVLATMHYRILNGEPA